MSEAMNIQTPMLYERTNRHTMITEMLETEHTDNDNEIEATPDTGHTTDIQRNIGDTGHRTDIQ